MIEIVESSNRYSWHPFWMAFLWNLVWINASEIFRYFVFVMPMMQSSFPQIENVAPMNWTVFSIWGLWDLILVAAVTSSTWLMMERFGHSIGKAVIAGTCCWLGIFVILWLGLYNMNLATIQILALALPLSWLELVIASLIVRRFVGRICNYKMKFIVSNIQCLLYSRVDDYVSSNSRRYFPTYILPPRLPGLTRSKSISFEHDVGNCFHDRSNLRFFMLASMLQDDRSFHDCFFTHLSKDWLTLERICTNR